MDFRCFNPKCKKLLFRGELDKGKIEIKCPKCGRVSKLASSGKDPPPKSASALSD
ncbi:MAG: Com family DNA-binding transcriptional regulator [Deltaproteobacteria bacterium]|nr:Com family DNA-binding transcriptional regulator [Deltaproteobacteria bacterium]